MFSICGLPKVIGTSPISVSVIRIVFHNLIDNILDVSRLESKRMPLRREAVFMQNLIQDMVQTQSTLTESRDLHVEVSVADDLPPVNADSTLVERVLQNLIGNAMKFTPEEGAIDDRRAQDNGKSCLARLGHYSMGTVAV